MAIAVLPDGPKSRWDRFLTVLFVLGVAVVLGLLAFSLLDAYVL